MNNEQTMFNNYKLSNVSLKKSMDLLDFGYVIFFVFLIYVCIEF